MNELSPSPQRSAYRRGQKRHKRKIRIWQIALVVALFGIWELVTRVGLTDGFLISSPSRMAATFINLCQSGDLWLHIGTSCLETVVGFILGTLFSVYKQLSVNINRFPFFKGYFNKRS